MLPKVEPHRLLELQSGRFQALKINHTSGLLNSSNHLALNNAQHAQAIGFAQQFIMIPLIFPLH